MMQRRRTDVKANNATIRRQMKPYNAHRRVGKEGKLNYQTKFVLITFAVILSGLYYFHEGGDVNDRKVPHNVDNGAAVNEIKITQNVAKDSKLDVTTGKRVKEAVTPFKKKFEKKSEEVKKSDNISDTENENQNVNGVGKESANANANASGGNSSSSHNDWHSMIQKIREEFYTRYGGEEEATAMLNRGIRTAADTEEHAVKHTAERIVRATLQKENAKKKFVISFGGYSVTVGRGNYYHQSYPFIMQNVLKPMFEKFLHLELVVRNSAIGGIPSFPYGWCLPNFLGDDADVISWDYGMNEGNGAEAFEAYLRQGISNLSKRPMMILLDNKRPRINLLKEYYKNNVLTDSIAVGRAEVVKKELLAKDEKDRPVGLQKWDEWGAPKGSPGQSSWHPKKMEHELIGWMLAMHFLDAIEAALKMLETVEGDSSIDLGIKDEDHERLVLLPEPVTGIPKGIPEAAVTHVLYGTQIDEKIDSNDTAHLWHMDRVSCRSNFLPNIKGHMSEIIVSGTADEIGDDLMDKTDEQYKSGWVLDVGKVERDTKRKVAKVGNGGLGYIDMKLALYGIPESGPLKLSLPHDGPAHNHENGHEHESDTKARHWFDALVFCEVNEKRGANECQTEKDLTFIVGGVKSSSVTKITSAASYLKKDICVNVEIPKDAIISEIDEKIELGVEVSITGKHVNRKDGACSISHVVWQSH
jgi:hypothetical protein